MIMSLFFSMAEVVHYKSLEKEAVSIGNSAVQSAFGEYNRLLWEDYGILAIDTDYGLDASGRGLLEDTVSNYIEKDFVLEDGGIDLLKLQVSEVNAQDNVFLTDHEGAAFIKEAVKCVEGELTEDAIQTLLGGCNECVEASDKEIDISDVLTDTQNCLSQIEDTSQEDNSNQADSIAMTDDSKQINNIKRTSGINRTDIILDGNMAGISPKFEEKNAETKEENTVEKSGEDVTNSLIAVIKDFESKGVLSQVLNDYDSVSNLAFSTEENVSNRELMQGEGNVDDVSLRERGLFQYYLTKKFSCYGEKTPGNGMEYELEYVLCGKNSDKENLTKTVERILAIREVENMISLSSDQKKMTEVKSMAATAAAVVLHPELEEVVSYGIMAAWAYLESVLDVRLLLSGGKVSLVKSTEEWTSELSQIATCLDTNVKAKECDTGITYKGYLFALFSIESQKKMAYRGLDLIEESLRQNEDYAYTKVDHCLVESCITTKMDASPLFMSFIPLYENNISGYEFITRRKISYL